MSTLKYADRAKQIVNKPVVNEGAFTCELSVPPHGAGGVCVVTRGCVNKSAKCSMRCDASTWVLSPPPRVCAALYCISHESFDMELGVYICLRRMVDDSCWRIVAGGQLLEDSYCRRVDGG